MTCATTFGCVCVCVYVCVCVFVCMCVGHDGARYENEKSSFQSGLAATAGPQSIGGGRGGGLTRSKQ
jgi:hypothetical protein